MPAKTLFASLFLAIFTVSGVHAAPKADLWERWLAHDPQATATVDHVLWDSFVKKYVVSSPDGINRVEYGQVSSQDRQSLDAYIAILQQTKINAFNRNEQRAYWINLYNALTVQVVLDHYPVKSIRDIDISPGFFAVGPWRKKLVRVEDQPVSLDEIEHRILRPIWRDARIHYAVNCASIGCPNLQREAFTAQNTEALLDRGAREYVNHPRGARVENQRLYVSSIYEWFRQDFGGSDTGVIEHLKRYAEPDLKKKLETVSRIAGDQYDWSLNDAH